MNEEIDYSRWTEFMQKMGNPLDKVRLDQREEATRIWTQAYVKWLEVQQKPAHLDFEVK